MPMSKARADLISRHLELLEYERKFDDPIHGGLLNEESSYWRGRNIYVRGILAINWSAFNRVMRFHSDQYEKDPFPADKLLWTEEQKSCLHGIEKVTDGLQDDMETLWFGIQNLFPMGQYWRAEIHGDCARCCGDCAAEHPTTFDEKLWRDRMVWMSKLLYGAITRAHSWNKAIGELTGEAPMKDWNIDKEYDEYWEAMLELDDDWKPENYSDQYLRWLR